MSFRALASPHDRDRFANHFPCFKKRRQLGPEAGKIFVRLGWPFLTYIPSTNLFLAKLQSCLAGPLMACCPLSLGIAKETEGRKELSRRSIEEISLQALKTKDCRLQIVTRKGRKRIY